MSAISEYDTQATLQKVQQLNFAGNIIPHAWFSHITFDNGKPDLLAMMMLSEIIYWYRPKLIKDERTGKLIGYEKKFKADKLQRSVTSFANQFGVSKRQAADALKRLEAANLITRELRTLETAMGKIGNVLYLAPVVEKIAEIQSALPLMQSNVIGGHDTATENNGDVYPLGNQTQQGAHPNVEGGTFERSTYTENTTQTSTENTAAAPLGVGEEKNQPAAAQQGILPEAPLSTQAESLIGTTLTPNQRHKIKVEVQVLKVDHTVENPEQLIHEISEGLLDPTCFSKCGNHFYHKLKAILNSIRNYSWNAPQTLLLQQQKQQDTDMKKLKEELRELESQIRYCTDMMAYATTHPHIDTKKMQDDKRHYEQSHQQLKAKLCQLMNTGEY